MKTLARLRRSRGFTLIEVVIALVILGSAMVVLLGLQSSILKRTIEEQRKQRAMLLARQVMTAVESQDDLPIEGSLTGRIDEILSGLHMISNTDQTLSDDDLTFRAEFNTSDWGIPGVADKAMRKFELIMRWGEAPDESLTVIYFTPNPDNIGAPS